MSYQFIGKSGLSYGASERSHKVHSRNYKIGVILQKEIQCLNVEEKNTACGIAVDQRIITTRFRNKLSRSYELMRHHDKIRSRFAHEELRPNRDKNPKQHRRNQNQTERHNDRSSSTGSEKSGATRSNDFNIKTFYDSNFRKNRPQTALESKAKEWKKNADNANQRVVRAKSAPPGSWRDCSEIMRILDSGRNDNRTLSNQRPLSRARFFEAFDLESFREFRDKEVKRQTEDVKVFVESLQPLKLKPWHPGPAPITKNGIRNSTKEKQMPSTFVTRVNNFM